MDINIHSSFLPHDDPEASLAFYRDTLGFEVRSDVGYEGMRWLTVGPADQPDVSIVLYPPGADPGITDDERRTITEMMAKGTYAMLTLATHDLDGAFEKLAGERRRGRPGADRPAVRRPRLRVPRPRRQHDPHQPGATERGQAGGPRSADRQCHRAHATWRRRVGRRSRRTRRSGRHTMSKAATRAGRTSRTHAPTATT